MSTQSTPCPMCAESLVRTVQSIYAPPGSILVFHLRDGTHTDAMERMGRELKAHHPEYRVLFVWGVAAIQAIVADADAYHMPDRTVPHA